MSISRKLLMSADNDLLIHNTLKLSLLSSAIPFPHVLRGWDRKERNCVDISCNFCLHFLEENLIKNGWQSSRSVVKMEDRCDGWAELTVPGVGLHSDDVIHYAVTRSAETEKKEKENFSVKEWHQQVSALAQDSNCGRVCSATTTNSKRKEDLSQLMRQTERVEGPSWGFSSWEIYRKERKGKTICKQMMTCLSS